MLPGLSSKAHIAGLLTVLLLAFMGFLAYLAVPKPCTGVASLVHATVLKDPHTAAAGGSPRSAAGSGTGTGSSANCTTPQQHGTLSAPVADLSMLPHLLPATNFSSIRSADVLDAAAAKQVDVQGLQQLMKLHNQLFCAANMHLETLPGSTRAPFGNVTMFVYDTNDIVSGQIKGASHGWEVQETQEMLWAIRQFPRTHQLSLKAAQGLAPGSSGSTKNGSAGLPSTPLVVDVGANVGWFMLNAAAAKARVAAFEAMPSNIALLRRSLCANPWLEEWITLYGTGLGTEPNTCYVISGTDNQGDGLTICGKDMDSALKDASSRPGYEVRGTITVRRLDTLLAEDVQMMKIDVEGHELPVLQGAHALLSQHNVWYIMAECNTGIIGEQRGKEFIQFMDKMGYAVSTRSFQGPFWSEHDVQTGTAACTNINLYCVKKTALATARKSRRMQQFVPENRSSGELGLPAGERRESGH